MLDLVLIFKCQNLDLGHTRALLYPQPVTLYQTGDNEEGAFFNNFLDALDSRFCTSDGGGDSTQDVIYPDNASGGWKSPENCGEENATYVISSSYGYNEADLTPFYEMRQCNEYLKLGLQDVTFLYSTGDNGVAGNGGQCIDGANRTCNDGKPKC
jgi:tripeptidyl-peptidase-1